MHISLIFSNLVVSKLLSAIVVDMRNFVANIRKILEIWKQFAGNQVNEKGNVPRRCVVPTSSDLGGRGTFHHSGGIQYWQREQSFQTVEQ